MFWFFDHEACRILAPRPGIEPETSKLEGKVSTTGSPGKSLTGILINECWLGLRREKTKDQMHNF